MIIYDVVQTVKPGAPCSYSPGRHLVSHFDQIAQAEAYAARCNLCCQIPEWVRYDVRPVDELDRSRVYDDEEKAAVQPDPYSLDHAQVSDMMQDMDLAEPVEPIEIIPDPETSVGALATLTGEHRIGDYRE